MDRTTSKPTNAYWIMLPSDPEFEGSPSETLLPSTLAKVSPHRDARVTAITTPAIQVG